MIDYLKLKDRRLDDVVSSYTERDTILYALSLGLGADPMNRAALRYVYGSEIVALPSYPVALGSPGFFAVDPTFGLDARRILHGEQHITLHGDIPTHGTVRAENRITRVIDKGDKGAVLHVERILRDGQTDRVISISEQVLLCRADGGFSTTGQSSDASPEPLPSVPGRKADHVVDFETRPDAALLYRLAGDLNPLHADPEVAAAAGFARPILHGLATFGIAMHAVLKCCEYKPKVLRSMGARFSAPAFPGDVIRTEIWCEGARLQLRASVPERSVTILANGIVELTPEGSSAIRHTAPNESNPENGHP
jgi:acyl dehydratase